MVLMDFVNAETDTAGKMSLIYQPVCLVIRDSLGVMNVILMLIMMNATVASVITMYSWMIRRDVSRRFRTV